MSEALALTPVAPGGAVLRRVAVTAGIAAILFAARWIDLPLLDGDQIRGVLGGAPEGVLSPVALHLTPFVSGYLIVEVLSLLHPTTRRLRLGSAADRLRLTRVAWGLAVLLAALQGWGIASYLQSLRGLAGGDPVLDPGLVPALVVTLTLVAGASVTAWGAVLITAHGLGNGFAVLYALDALGKLVAAVLAGRASLGVGWTESAALFLLAVVVVVPIVVARGQRDADAAPRMPLLTCGLAVVQGPSVLLSLAVGLGAVASLDVLQSWRGLDHLARGAIEVGLVAALGAVLARLFCPSGGVGAAFSRAGRQAAPDATVSRALGAAHRRSLALVIGVALLPVVAEELGAPILIPVELLMLVAIVLAVAADLRAEARARADAPDLLTARGLHRVYAVGPALETLAAAGIPAFARARHYRGLFHFFAPWAPVEILVPPERAAEAEALCAGVEVG